jgi:transposase
LLIGYFEGIDGERGIAWRLADSLALRKFSKLDKSCLQVVVQRVG